MANRDTTPAERTLGLAGATGIGVGAIVGGGILVLSGVAFRSTGPAALVAFALNGLIAFLTALSFAEISAAFPESGGPYVFAKKVLNVRAAFRVGWILWFAYIVAGALYAMGFAEFAAAAAVELWPGEAPVWVNARPFVLLLALGATGAYTLELARRAGGGGDWVSWGKVVVFGVLIVAGFWALSRRDDPAIRSGLDPFFTRGGLGLVEAMGFTFIALQGFEVIAAVAGEVKNPGRTIPRAMFLSLGCALAIYLPLLFLISTAGVLPGDSIGAMSARAPETVMADAVRNYLGVPGFWLVMAAAVLSTLSALRANLLAASRVASTMARDRTLPGLLGGLHHTRGTPVFALVSSVLALVTILLVMPDLAAAGAAASLIFLLLFALGHWTSYLARRRRPHLSQGTFRTPLFPLVPIVGGGACLALAAFQAVAVPAAGAITLVWFGLGALLYVGLVSERASAVDAQSQAGNPELTQLRGQAPVVLVPVANPRNAANLVSIAGALAPPRIGHVLLMNVVQSGGEQEHGDPVSVAQEVLGEALRAAMAAGHSPRALLSVSASPWDEIGRVARQYRCHGVLLGQARLDERGVAVLENLMAQVEGHVSFLFADPSWSLARCRKILVPIGGRSGHYTLRARLLGSLCRDGEREVIWLRVISTRATDSELRSAGRALRELAADATPGNGTVIVERSDEPTEVILARAEAADLLILGLHDVGGRRLFGRAVPELVRRASCATLIISRRQPRGALQWGGRP